MSFYDLGKGGYWWTATETRSGLAYYRYMGYDRDYVYEGDNGKNFGFSVRCVSD